MFHATSPRTGLGAVVRTLELIYHTAVHSIRSSHHNAFLAIGMNILQALTMVAVFYLMFSIMGMRRFAVRGDFLLYIMSGIFMYMTHIRAVTAVNAGGPLNPMLLHSPLNSAIVILGNLLSAFYIQVLTVTVVLGSYHMFIKKVEILDLMSLFGMFALSFFTGIGAGLIFLALKPWAPKFAPILQSLYQRANMIASGKMFVGNSLPPMSLAMFDWNPLFHCIDQARGYAFINYFPRNSSWEYAFWVGVVLIMLGLMAEFYTRKQASLSWNAKV